MNYSASFLLNGLPSCQMIKFNVQRNEVTPVPIVIELNDKISLEPKMLDFFQILIPGSFASFSLQEHTVPHLKDLYFIYSSIPYKSAL